ncbi:arsenite methyltransferase [candidate division WOR-3 bacterium]|nr:arsenite methyltransferase [candidate division WOR-3 bacterium]
MPSERSDIRRTVREGYAQVARESGSCCGPTRGCCGATAPEATSRAVGYSEEELAALPEGANLGLGCGNPVALASLRPGETVLDLGSGAGIDCFLAAQKVGSSGRVIGVDMTPDMVERARANARKSGAANVEFRLGEIEHLPVADSTVDIVISNCVINLSPDKPQVFREAFRVLKPGGRLMVSDIVLDAPLPRRLRDSVAAYVGCISGASLKADYLALISTVGFADVKVVAEDRFPVEAAASDPTLQALVRESGLSVDELRSAAAGVRSANVSAQKP